jgi:hypothetical protein
MATELTPVGGNPVSGSPNPNDADGKVAPPAPINIHTGDIHQQHSATQQPSDGAIGAHNVAFHFEDGHAAAAITNPTATSGGGGSHPASPTSALAPPAPAPVVPLLPGSGGNEEDFLARFRGGHGDEKVDEKRIDVARPKRVCALLSAFRLFFIFLHIICPISMLIWL